MEELSSVLNASHFSGGDMMPSIDEIPGDIDG